MDELNNGYFTLPGEAGYEDLTLRLASEWGADVIRDSDGTVLSDTITDAGYGIYSTICLIRSVNPWAKQNPDKLQQNFLISDYVVAESDVVEISLTSGYFSEQFRINSSKESILHWQVFDRTTNEEIPQANWSYSPDTMSVTVTKAVPWHRYTVNFLAFRIWEEISMYNHITNDWGDKEHLMSVDVRYPEVRAELLRWLRDWCESHPATTVVRFTSMFYNFSWFWGDKLENRTRFSDWGSYDFTVSPKALDEFAAEYGYRMTSEDFVNAGKYNSTHNPPSKKYLDWIDFVNKLVVSFGKECVNLVHSYGKQAYVFYDDSWIGIEPYGRRFSNFGFDGLIKCVFSGFEARLCAHVSTVDTHELRLHPYLFPLGLNGEPTFAPGGNPTADANRFWANVRRALLRKPVDRIGLGGYLHLVEPFPDFCERMKEIANEFRTLKKLHSFGEPAVFKGKIGILTSWGRLRSWTCSGHLHEHPEVDLINIIEALSGLPFEVEFFNFDDIKKGIPDDIKVIINAGCAGSAWSGGYNWNDSSVISVITEWVHNGGAFLGVNDPSAYPANDCYFQLAHILGVDKDTGDRKCIGKYTYQLASDHFITKDFQCSSKEQFALPENPGIFVTESETVVLSELSGAPELTVHEFGKGLGIYLAGYRYSLENARLLARILCYACREADNFDSLMTDTVPVEIAQYPLGKHTVLINNSGETQTVNYIDCAGNSKQAEIPPYECVLRSMN